MLAPLSIPKLNAAAAVIFAKEQILGLGWCCGRASFRNTREGWNCRVQKNTPHGRWGQGPGSVDPRFLAGLPFPVPEILEFT